MPRKKKKKASWKSPKVRKKVHKLAGRIQKQIGKTLKGDKNRKSRIAHGIAYGKITGRKPKGGVRAAKGRKRKKKR